MKTVSESSTSQPCSPNQVASAQATPLKDVQEEAFGQHAPAGTNYSRPMKRERHTDHKPW